MHSQDIITGLSHNPNWQMRELWTTEVMLCTPNLTGCREQSQPTNLDHTAFCPVFLPAHHAISNRRGRPRADQERRHRSCLFWTLNDQESSILILPCGRKQHWNSAAIISNLCMLIKLYLSTLLTPIAFKYYKIPQKTQAYIHPHLPSKILKSIETPCCGREEEKGHFQKY